LRLVRNRCCITVCPGSRAENCAWSRPRPRARKEDPSMELAAVILFGTVVLWFVEETTDEHI
jgi:hypothetical protein